MSEDQTTDAGDGRLARIVGAPAKVQDGEGQDRGRIEPPVSEDLPSPRAPAESQISTAEDSAEASADAPPALAPIPAGVEIELKLVTDREHLADLQRAPVIEAYARNRGVHRHLLAIYYDTPGRRLHKAGFVLRVRRSGSRFTQTVKTEGSGDGLRRGEWETPVPDMSPDLRLALPLLPEKLARKVAADTLVPVFSTDVHRLVRRVLLPSGEVEVAFDHGLLTAGARTAPLCEIELELKGGAPQTLHELGLRLLEYGALRPSLITKAARGFALADDPAPVVPKPALIPLDPDAPLDEALAVILQGALHHLLRALPVAEDGRNPEGIHQARVALRRLRSMFGLMRPVAGSPVIAGFGAEAKRLAASLGTARDCDVFVEDTLGSVAAALPGLDGFDGLRQAAETRRSEGYAAAREALADQRTSRFVLALGGFIEGRGWRNDVSPDVLWRLSDPVIAFADRTLSALHAKVLKRGKHFKSMAPEARHELRIAVKKLRYAMDFLLPVYRDSKTTKRFAKALSRLQEQLGRYNDMATTRKIVAGFGDNPAAHSQAAGAVIGWQAQGLAAAEPGLRKAWSDFAEARPPWKGATTPD